MINLTLLNLFGIKRLRRKHMHVNAYAKANLIAFIWKLSFDLPYYEFAAKR